MDKKKLFILLTIANVLILSGYLIISLTVFTKKDSKQPVENLFNTNSQVFTNNEQIVHDLASKKYAIIGPSKEKLLTGTLGNSLELNDYEKINIEKSNNGYNVKFKGKSKIASIELSVNSKAKPNDITCTSYKWTVTNNDEKYANQEFEDCFNLGDSYWYGGAESFDQQFWPINQQDFSKHLPYLTGLFGKWSSILERYWLSSSGLAIVVDQSIPLFVLKNKTSICLLASSKEPYNENRIVKLTYDVCQIDSSKSQNDYLNKLHLYVINNYFAKPKDYPDERMLKSPIWSTWANFKKRINETSVRAFANDILSNGYSNSQIEIDDKWQTAYGDFSFDTEKFPDIKRFVTELNKMGFRTTLWVHPFANYDSENFRNLSLNFLVVRAPDGLHPGLTSWWDGLGSVILDTTNPYSTNWFVSELEKLRNLTGIDSFKFDAGEIEWLPKKFWLYNDSISPDEYSIGYARMASRLGKMIEVRTGCQTQDLPIFVRMLDKDSKWGYNNGLKSVLTTALTMSILGYPFILPDMIGGNAYIYNGEEIDFETELIAYPDYQLYIRWAQMTAFLPSMQFSIPPWHYNNKTNVPVNRICRELVQLHENIVYPILIKEASQATKTGSPIIRPVWWIDNSDKNTFILSDQFLVGNDILVAPITDENRFKRDIYVPRGKWLSENKTIYTGPIWLRDYPAPIDKIPYFINQPN